MACIYKRKHSPYWWVKYYVNGKAIPKSLKVRNKEAAIRLRNRLEEQLALGEAGLAGLNDIPIDDYYKEFLDYTKRRGRRPRTLEGYESLIPRFTAYIKQEFPQIKMLSQIKRPHIEKYRSSRDVSGTTINYDLRYLKRYFNVAKELGHIKDNPTDGIEKIKVIKKSREIYSENEIRLMLKAPPKLRRMFITLLQTGLRKMELVHLDWPDVRFNKGVIAVTVKPDFIPKDNERREIPLRKETRQALMEIRQDKGRVFKGIGRHLDRTLKRYFDKIGIKGNVKKFRHTYASYTLGCGIPLQNVQKYLGHSNAETTQVYLQTVPDKISKDIREFFGGKR